MITLVREKSAIQQSDTSKIQVREPMEAEITVSQKPDVAVQKRVGRPLFPYPSWPTSKPGPKATYRLPGQKPMPDRSDQMVYEAYDQVRGRPIIDSSEIGSLDSRVNEKPFTEKGVGTFSIPGMDGTIDISGASLVGKRPLSPAETGHYHYGPRGPGINTDASGSYAPYEIDPRGRPVDRPVKLYIT